MPRPHVMKEGKKKKGERCLATAQSVFRQQTEGERRGSKLSNYDGARGGGRKAAASSS